MNSLPHELLETIVSHLDSDKLAPFASTSVTFQELIERRTFRELEIRSADIDQFVVIVTGSRRQVLRLLDYRIALPAVAKSQRNNLGFTQAVHDLFSALSLWDTGSRLNSIKLSIAVIEDNIHPRIDYRRSILELGAVDSLPAVPLIHTLRPDGDVYISDSSWINIASRLPNLECLDVHLNHQRPGLDLDQRRHDRHSLAEALNNLNTSHLVHLVLFSPAIGWSRYFFRHTPNLLLPDDAANTDHLSLALNRLLRRSPQLRTFDICGAIPLSRALFAVDDDNENTTASSFPPRLERLSISLPACAPDGTPYFAGAITSSPTDIAAYADDGFSDIDDDGRPRPLYRWTGAAAESFRPFILAAARFASADRLPRLRSFTLETQFDHCSVGYAAPGVAYPACEWLGEVDPLGKENLWLPRCYVDVRGFEGEGEGDEEVEEAWGGIREGGLVHWGPVTGFLVG